MKFGAVGAISLAATPILNCIIPEKAYAAPSITRLPDSQALISSDLCLKLLRNNSTFRWKSVQGFVDNTYSSDTSVFYVPKGANSIRGGWSYSDILEITFHDVGTINNKNLNTILTIDKLTMTGIGNNIPDRIEFFRLGDTYYPQFGAAVNGNYGYHTMLIDYTIDIRYADTDKTVEVGFFQRASDLDQGYTEWQEAWTPTEGFLDEFYVYESCFLGIDGYRFAAHVPRISTDGNDALTKAAVLAKTENGKFSGCFEEAGCSSALEIFTPLTNIKNPTKSAIITK